MKTITLRAFFLVVVIYGCASVLGQTHRPDQLERVHILTVRQIENVRNKDKIDHVKMRKNMRKRGLIRALEEPGLVPVILITDGSEVSGAYIARLKNNATFEQVQGILNATSRRLNFNNQTRFVIFEGISESELQVLRHRPDLLVEIEEDNEAKLDTFCTPSYDASNEWNLDRIDGKPKDDLFKSWGDGTGVQIYVLDTGINVDHEEFEGRTAPGWYPPNYDWYFKDTTDEEGHGTHVASVAGGTKYGVAKNVTLIPVKVCRSGCRVSHMIEGLNWVEKQVQSSKNLSVINMSISGLYNKAVNDAVEAVLEAGIPVVVPAGNNQMADACTISPASVPAALTVGATHWDDKVADFSNIGPCVDIYAPGVNIRGALHYDNSGSLRNVGTSLAAPHVAGAAAGLLQVLRAANVLSEPSPLAVTYVNYYILLFGEPNAVIGLPSENNTKTMLHTGCIVQGQ